MASLIPLFYEICAEGAYPIGESSTAGFITWLNNAACLVFLLVASVKSFGNVFHIYDSRVKLFN